VCSRHDLHPPVEAADLPALYRGAKGLSVRIAKRMNKMMGRCGRVIGDRYHARLLRTPTAVRRVATYIRENYQRHATARGERLAPGYRDPYSSDASGLGFALPPPQSWLARRAVSARTSSA
jgi:hypothetical protein